MEVNNNITEELFCQKFEIDSLSETLIHNHSERWLHGFIFPNTEAEHMDRYRFAFAYVKGKSVLDIAGGCGYGSWLLASEGGAASVQSVELSASSVRYANHRYRHEKVQRFTDNAETWCKTEFYDTIISFETIEHLKGYESFLANMALSLKQNGTFIVSTPVIRETSTQVTNPYHVIEWSYADFHKLLEKWFTVEETFVQNVYVSAGPSWNIPGRLISKLTLGELYHGAKKGIFRVSEIKVDPSKFDGGYQILVCRKK